MNRLARFLLVFTVLLMAFGTLPVLAQGGAGHAVAVTLQAHWLLITCGFAMAVAAAGCGYAQSRALTAACEGVSRNPGAADSIRFFIILGLAFIEFLALLTFVVVAILVFTPKFWPVAAA
ncbi:MAG TPA: ATP synthase F0 subunit C [Acidobacteriota bacterium]|jgi:F-type H+-transporting ATPase subunit c